MRSLALALLLLRPIRSWAGEVATCDAARSCREGSFCDAGDGGIQGNGTCAECDGRPFGCLESDLTGAAVADCFHSCYCRASQRSGALLDVDGLHFEGVYLQGGGAGSAAGPLVDVGLGTEDVSAYSGGDDVSGSVCLIEGGDVKCPCKLIKKIANCQNNGGVGAVIFNLRQTMIQRLRRSIQDYATAIPSLAIGMAEGQQLKSAGVGNLATVRLCEVNTKGQAIETTMAGVILAKVSGSLSIIGSSFVVRNAFKKWRTCRSNEGLPTVTRVVLSMSLADLGSSFWCHFLGTWMVPATTTYVAPLAAGNRATCSTQAFFFHLFTFSGAWSNVLLAVAYWLVVSRQVPERKLQRWYYQLPLLGWPWLIGLSVALLNVIGAGGGQVYRQGVWYCTAWASSYWLFVFIFAVTGLGVLAIVCSMGSLTRNMYQTESRSRKYRQAGESTSIEQTKSVAKQGLHFTAAFLVIMIPMILVLAMSDLPNWYYAFFACVFPLQGFLNSLVFFRPKFIAVRKRQGESGTRMGVLVEVLDVAAPDFVSSLARSLSSLVRSSLGSLGRIGDSIRRTLRGSIRHLSTSRTSRRDNPTRPSVTEHPETSLDAKEILAPDSKGVHVALEDPEASIGDQSQEKGQLEKQAGV